MLGSVYGALDMSSSMILTAMVMVVVVIVLFNSMWTIGPTQIGLVRKRFSLKRLKDGSPVALNGEAGYQADLLTTGLRFKLWPIYTVEHHPLVQIPAGQIGVVIAQVGNPPPIGAKSAEPTSENSATSRAFATL